MTRTRFALAVALLGSVASVAGAQTHTFQDGADGYDGTQDASLYPGVESDFNTGGQIVTYANTGTRSIYKFDLSSLKGKKVSGPATLTLSIANTSMDEPATVPFSLYAIADANADWKQGNNGFAAADDEGEVTYNHRAHPKTAWAGTAGMSTSGTDFKVPALDSDTYDQSPAAEAKKIELTLPAELVQHWIDGINAGVLLSADSAPGAVQFYSSEAVNLANRPKLTVQTSP